LCAAALVGIVVTELTHPPMLEPLLLAALLSGIAAPLVWRRRLWRSLALLACATSLGAARGTLSDRFVSGLAPPGPSLVGRLAPLRDGAQAGIVSYLPEPQASLAAGVLLGGRGHLDLAFRRDLERSGLGHIVAIDGFKLVIVGVALGAVTTRVFGAKLEMIPRLVVISGYTLLSGGHPSAIRATLMVGLTQVAAMGGRQADPLTSLGMATLGMALVDTRVLLDVGLQLSLSATLSLVLLWPVIRRWLRLWALPKLIGEPMGLTLAVTLGCLPVMLGAFQTVSLISPVAHVLAVPLLPAVLVCAAGLALTAALPLPSPVVSAAAWLAWLPSSLLAATIHLFGSLPGAAVSTGRLPPLAGVALAAGLLTCGVWHLPELSGARHAWSVWRTRQRATLLPATVAGVCASAVALCGPMLPGGQPAVMPLALERGQAVFIRGPTGRTALVVQGSTDGRVLVEQVADHLAVWEHKLDLVVVRDAGAERALGLTLARYPAEQLVRDTSASARLDVGATQTLSITSPGGNLSVSIVQADPTSAQTTSAARPGSAD
jgi:competence protein ComEC